MITWEEIQIDKPTIVTLGVFDGVHKGHQKILNSLVDKSLTLGLPGVVITFHPHPSDVITKSHIGLIMDLEDRIKLIEKFPHSYTVLIQFNEEFSKKLPIEFVEELIKRFNIKEIIVGYNFQFGKARRGDVNLLKNLGETYGFKVLVVPPVEYKDRPISSSRIREELKKGNIKDANEMLGRPFSIKGRVLRGKGLGKELGFPTANILPPEGILIPRFGVYASIGEIEDGRRYIGVTSIGIAPTVRADQMAVVETHLLDFSGDIYDRFMRINLIEWLRPEVRFKSIDALVEQIRKDISITREIMKHESFLFY
ncbi:MAG: bifunctional riboflavin kinase/FAD synthetase [bacterium]